MTGSRMTRQLPSPTPAGESRQRCADLADCQGLLPSLSRPGLSPRAGRRTGQRRCGPRRFVGRPARRRTWGGEQALSAGVGRGGGGTGPRRRCSRRGQPAEPRPMSCRPAWPAPGSDSQTLHDGGERALDRGDVGGRIERQQPAGIQLDPGLAGSQADGSTPARRHSSPRRDRRAGRRAATAYSNGCALGCRGLPRRPGLPVGAGAPRARAARRCWPVMAHPRR